MSQPLPPDTLLTLGEAQRLGAARLKQAGLESPALEMSLLLAHALGLTRLDVYTQSDRPLNPAERERARGLLARRLRREPLAYIVGRKEFFGHELAVSPAVLIPRPETEHLVEHTRAFLQGAAAPAGAVLELGTGSGAVAIALACALGGGRPLVATDVSAAALDVARANAVRHGVADQIEFRLGGLDAPLRPGEQFAALVSNPPYIAPDERATLAPEVREHEPAVALFAPEEGLALLRAIIALAPDRLLPGGLLALECGHTQTEALCAQLGAQGGWREVRVAHDLANLPRNVLAVRG